jgi:hypothetical protein
MMRKQVTCSEKAVGLSQLEAAATVAGILTARPGVEVSVHPSRAR